MNIFALDDNPVLSAQWQHDRHVVKMTLETAQLLSTVILMKPKWYALAHTSNLYKPTHPHHPSTLWVKESKYNLAWLVAHGYGLADEYFKRYGRRHKSASIIDIACDLCNVLGVNDESARFHTQFAVAMPDQYKIEGDPINSYRRYYVAEKLSGNTYKRTEHLPDWLKPLI